METREQKHERMLKYFADKGGALENYVKFYDYYGAASNFDQLFTTEYGNTYDEIKDLDLNSFTHCNINKMISVYNENSLKTIANIILFIGCIFVVVVLVGGLVLSNRFGVPYILYVAISLIMLFFTIGLWAFLLVICNTTYPYN